MIEARTPTSDRYHTDCAGCGGTKSAPIATVLSIYQRDLGVTIALCEICGRDLANAVGFMCVKDGGWSKLEPRQSKTKTKRKIKR